MNNVEKVLSNKVRLKNIFKLFIRTILHIVVLSVLKGKKLFESDGSYTVSAEETLTLLLETHFPGSWRDENDDDELPLLRVDYRLNREPRSLSYKIFTPENVRAPIADFSGTFHTLRTPVVI